MFLYTVWLGGEDENKCVACCIQATGQTVLSSNHSRGKKFVSSPERPDWFWSPSSLLWNVYVGFCQAIKRPGREVNHPPPSRAKVENEWSYTSTPLNAFMVQTGRNLYIEVVV